MSHPGRGFLWTKPAGLGPASGDRAADLLGRKQNPRKCKPKRPSLLFGGVAAFATVCPDGRDGYSSPKCRELSATMTNKHWLRTLLFLLLAFIAPTSGCMAIRQPDGDASVAPDSWLQRTRKQFARAYEEIQQDLNFHENEALDQFAPDATKQREEMRSSLNGPGGIERKAFY